jgi:hypothetical protein
LPARGPRNWPSESEDFQEDTSAPSWETIFGVRDVARGCEFTETQEGFYCLTHGRNAERGASRCGTRGERVNPDEYTRKHIEDYVRGVLGIKEGKNFTRLVERRRYVPA